MARPRKSTMGLYRVVESFGVPDADGYLVSYPRGTLLTEDHPLVKTHRMFMEPAEDGAVEQATAAPGEKRNLSFPSGVTVEEATAHHSGHADNKPKPEPEPEPEPENGVVEPESD